MYISRFAPAEEGGGLYQVVHQPENEIPFTAERIAEFDFPIGMEFNASGNLFLLALGAGESQGSLFEIDGLNSIETNDK